VQHPAAEEQVEHLVGRGGIERGAVKVLEERQVAILLPASAAVDRVGRAPAPQPPSAW
jgi:hypothetical protein